jgi:hypothetical protein
MEVQAEPFDFSLRSGSVPGRYGHAPSPEPREKIKIPGSERPQYFLKRSAIQTGKTIPAKARVSGRRTIHTIVSRSKCNCHNVGLKTGPVKTLNNPKLMNQNTSIKTASAMLICAGVFFTASVSHAATYDVTIDTTPLIGNPNGPYYLNLAMTYGGAGVGNNATISGFSSAGVGTPTIQGLAAGNLSSSVTVADNNANFYNDFYQQFTPGTSLSFIVQLSDNLTGQTPDLLGIGIDDNSTYQIPTTDPNGNINLADFTIRPNAIDVSTFTGAVDPYSGFDYSGVSATVTVVPEASNAVAGVFALLSVGLPLLGRKFKTTSRQAE